MTSFFFVVSIIKSYRYSRKFNIEVSKVFPEQKTSSINKKISIIYFWANWCIVCEKQKLLINYYYEQSQKSNNFDFISIEEGADLKFLQNYVRENNIKFPVYIGNQSSLKKWNIRAFPTFFFLDKNQKIQFVDSGILTPLGFYLRIFYINLMDLLFF